MPWRSITAMCTASRADKKVWFWTISPPRHESRNPTMIEVGWGARQAQDHRRLLTPSSAHSLLSGSRRQPGGYFTIFTGASGPYRSTRPTVMLAAAPRFPSGWQNDRFRSERRSLRPRALLVVSETATLFWAVLHNTTHAMGRRQRQRS